MLRKLAFILVVATTAAFAQQKTIYLTFDDGPQPGTTDVLDVLKAEGAHGVFFLTGKNAESVGGIEGQAKIILRTVAEGHELANHTYSHDPATKAGYIKTYGDLSTEAQRSVFRKNFARNESEIGRRIGQPDFKFTMARLPGDGSTFPHLVAETEAMGMKHFHWANEFGYNGSFGHLKNTDWKGITGVAGDYGHLPKDGDVILFHDRHWAGEKRESLRALIKFLKEKGYTFGKLADRKAPVPKTAVPPKSEPAAIAVPTSATPPPAAPSK
jgi:peptidoglycan-N-acetylglucosamine deacetylase